DRNLQERLMSELHQILKEMKQTALYVTHDQEEAFAVSDRVVVMDIAKVIQIGTPQDIYKRPKTSFVAQFLGLSNLLDGEIRKEGDQYTVKTAIGLLPISKTDQESATILIRPETMYLNDEFEYFIEGIVVRKSFKGSICHIVVQVNGKKLRFDLHPLHNSIPDIGETIKLSFNPREAIQVIND
ncbi:MAG: TOBE domain-containing protein, partial [Anaerolineales bacterium]